METRERAEIENRLAVDAELAQLWSEHLALELQLAALQGHRYLSSDETLEQVRLKKLKLAGRDRIAAILAQAGAR